VKTTASSTSNSPKSKKPMPDPARTTLPPSSTPTSPSSTNSPPDLASKRFRFAYAYSVSAYADFIVEAATQSEAEEKANEALKAGRFDDLECQVYWSSTDDFPVFCLLEETESADNISNPSTLNQLTKSCPSP